MINLDKSRGFGFVTFFDPSIVDFILKIPHFIDGKCVECKIAIPKEHINSNEEETSVLYNSKKIFVGGLPPNIKENEMKIYFEQYGEIDQCVIMKDKPTGKSRGI